MMVPKLRFKNFESKIEKKNLSDYIVEYRGGAPLTPSDFVSANGVEVIPKKAIIAGGELSLDSNNPTMCSHEFYRNYKKNVVDSSFLITTLRDLVPSGPNIGYIVLNRNKDNEYVLAQGVYGFKINEKLNANFLSQLSNTKKYRLMMNKMMVGSTQVHIRNDDFFSMPIFVPTLAEQTKISDFLSSIDEKITLLNKQYDLLCQYKKGMMQKIFSQKVRFKDENREEFSDWNEILLGKVGKIITGKTPNTSVAEYWNGDILFTTPTDMNDSIKYLAVTERKVSSKGIKQVLPKGTIMFTCIASIGKMALSTLPCITNQQINSIIVNEKYNNEFIYYNLQYIKPKIIANQANTTVPIVNKTDFSAISLHIPSLAEQTKIANALCAIDDKITTKKTELDKLKTWKQGLLQQMFV
ncbi:restriction endonuclease subunit S [Klebsiella michiganensis]|uniref:restriction endonuclease subunit S n=1 Tax=Klebsiella michiganensis TaxID=1134687 RepID=UPI000A2E1FDA|nr:restriction endonuclease subunit S [Klebsiella michiganensis]OSY95234.1 hypothetical protein BM280_06745 [Klebsiella michiganensis]